MNLHDIVRFSIVIVMVVAFLCQMWDLFGHFLSELTTVAISFEENETFELPSFAFCDSRAFKKSVSIEKTYANYNDAAFDLEHEIVFKGMMKTVGRNTEYSDINHTVEVVPTMFNGYCKLYEFHQDHPVMTYIGKNTRGNYHYFYTIHKYRFSCLCVTLSIFPFHIYSRIYPA